MMEFFETVKRRRSIRRYKPTRIPEGVVRKALEAAVLAPNSSNSQTWDFYWVRSQDKREQLVQFCLNQSAARTASDLVVIVASPTQWRRSWPALVKYVNDINAPKPVRDYYERLFPLLYRWGVFNLIGLFKGLVLNATGLLRPSPRGPASKRGVQEVAIKSAALAAENFVLAITAQGYSSCMMEGFDEVRVKRLLQLKGSDRVVMVIAVGEEDEPGTWGPQFRIPTDQVIHEI